MEIKKVRSLEDLDSLEEGDFVEDTAGQLMVKGSWDDGPMLYAECEKDGRLFEEDEIIGAYSWVDLRIDDGGITLLPDSAIRLDKNSKEYLWVKHLLTKQSPLVTK